VLPAQGGSREASREASRAESRDQHHFSRDDPSSGIARVSPSRLRSRVTSGKPWAHGKGWTWTP
jgi:hypothetical protein